jgi:hypothetical protein
VGSQPCNPHSCGPGEKEERPTGGKSPIVILQIEIPFKHSGEGAKPAESLLEFE